MFNRSTLAAAFWLNFFAMYWLLLLEVVEPTGWTIGALFFFFLNALICSASRGNTPPKQKGGNGRR